MRLRSRITLLLSLAIAGLAVAPKTPACALLCEATTFPYVPLPHRCNDNIAQEHMFECLADYCDSSSYGPALLHHLSTCSTAGHNITRLYPRRLLNNDLPLQQRSDLTYGTPAYGAISSDSGTQNHQRIAVVVACHGGADSQMTVTVPLNGDSVPATTFISNMPTYTVAGSPITTLDTTAKSPQLPSVDPHDAPAPVTVATSYFGSTEATTRSSQALPTSIASLDSTGLLSSTAPAGMSLDSTVTSSTTGTTSQLTQSPSDSVATAPAASLPCTVGCDDASGSATTSVSVSVVTTFVTVIPTSALATTPADSQTTPAGGPPTKGATLSLTQAGQPGDDTSSTTFVRADPPWASSSLQTKSSHATFIEDEPPWATV